MLSGKNNMGASNEGRRNFLVKERQDTVLEKCDCGWYKKGIGITVVFTKIKQRDQIILKKRECSGGNYSDNPTFRVLYQDFGLQEIRQRKMSE